MIDLFPTARLHEEIEAACGTRIVSVSVGNRADKKTWVVQFDGDATDDQKLAAQAAIEAFENG